MDSSRKRKERPAPTSSSPKPAGASGSVRNRHRGSSFDSFLKEEGVFNQVQATAIKRAVAEAVEDGMAQVGLSKIQMARRMKTSRSQLDRVLDPDCTTVQLDTLIKAANAVGHELHISLKRIS